MLFDPAPKQRIEDFFDNEASISSLSSKLAEPKVRAIVVLGPRRTGKTSLMRVTLAKTGLPNVFMDARAVESRQDFYRKLSAGLEGVFKGIRLSALEFGARIEFGSGDNDITQAIKGKKFVLVIDEAQLLSSLGIANFLAYIYDNEKGIKLLISGSEVGLLNKFIGQEDADSPLFGRAIETIRTERLGPNEASRFIKAGAAELKLDITDAEISDAIANLDGIIGWLTLYGWTRRGMAHGKALAEAIRQGALLTRSEFDKFLASAKAGKRYLAIAKAIAKGERKWGGVKAFAEKELGYAISDSQFGDYINSLVNHEFIDASYSFVDPLLERAFRE